jgi:hypothetical protein
MSMVGVHNVMCKVWVQGWIERWLQKLTEVDGLSTGSLQIRKCNTPVAKPLAAARKRELAVEAPVLGKQGGHNSGKHCWWEGRCLASNIKNGYMPTGTDVQKILGM